MSKKTKKLIKRNSSDKPLMESFSPWISVGKILPTSVNVSRDIPFDHYRPDRSCVDYNISQTRMQMMKGDVKVNMKQTEADYKDIPKEICKPKKGKKRKLFSGMPAPWKFVEEIREEKIEKLQKQASIHRNKTDRKKLLAKRKLFKATHTKIEEMCGPKWFVELSPQQLDAVNNLQRHIAIDLENGSVIKSQEIIARLGLVLRPNQHHFAVALKYCCGSAIEFLLVLYHILNPKRLDYSWNDCLILSAVVHLGLRETLRELHVRIPSPPRCVKKRRKVIRKVKHRQEKSPYLRPLTYTPPKPKFSKVYRNKPLQYPENPYFSYLLVYHFEKLFQRTPNFSTTIEDSQGKERMQEYLAAQKFFETIPLVKTLNLYLVPPKVRNLCLNILRSLPLSIDQRFLIPSLRNVSESEPDLCYCHTIISTDKKLLGNERCLAAAQKLLAKFCVCDDCLEEVARKNITKIHGGMKNLCVCGKMVPIIEGIKMNKTCTCLKEFRNRIVARAAQQKIESNSKKCVITGVTMTKFGPIYNISSTLGKRICRCKEIKNRKKQLNIRKTQLLNNNTKFVIGGVTMTQDGPIYNLTAATAKKPCKCAVEYEKKKTILAMQNKIRINPKLVINCGLINSSQGPVFHYGGITNRKMDESAQQQNGSNSTIMSSKYLHYSQKHSECKSVDGYCNCSTSRVSNGISSEYAFSSSITSSTNSSILSTTSSHTLSFDKAHARPSNSSNNNVNVQPKRQAILYRLKCPCEKCDRKIHQQQHPSSYIIHGTKLTASGNKINVTKSICQPLCKYLHGHIENRKKIDNCKNRIKVKCEFRKKQPDKYTINGVANTPEGLVVDVTSGLRPPIECECAQYKQEREKYERERALMPNTGRIKYEVIGVKASPDGERNVYILNNALAMPKCECEKLLEEFEMAHKSCLSEFDSYMQKTQTELEQFDEIKSTKETDRENNRETQLNAEQSENQTSLPLETEQNQKTEQTKETSCSDMLNSSDDDNDSSVSSEIESGSSESDLELQLTRCCQIEKPLDVEPIQLPAKAVLLPHFLSKRFAIFRKFPKRHNKQMEILIQILKGMADDGYPLANLPDIHKLPIFKLWFQMRCGITWSYKDRCRYYNESKKLWEHTDLCYRKLDKIRMPFTRAERAKLTWKEANMIRRVAEEKRTKYYRSAKYSHLTAARELFATTFPYEFPTKTWRHCFSAYMATKEEQLHPFLIYRPDDMRIIPEHKKYKCAA